MNAKPYLPANGGAPAGRLRSTLCRAGRARSLALAACFMGIPCAAEPEDGAPLKIVIAGDSTVASYPATHANRGWGQYVEEAFREGTVKVVNLAASGRSAKTFVKDGLWKKALGEKPGYIFIQFGHNDSHAPEKPESTAANGGFKDYLRRYIDEAREAGAQPVLVTPVVRRTFDPQGRLTEEGPVERRLAAYADSMKAVAEEKDAAVIDLHALSWAFIDELGPEESRKLASKRNDPTHFNERGARATAALVLKALPSAIPELQPRLKAP